MKQSLTLTLGLIFSFTCWAQMYNISGKVYEKGGKEIVPFANIFVDSIYKASTNTNGEYLFKTSKGDTSLL